ncbi:PREDICTED: G-type lectin S-receptor-like serine/threonine-protein kinase At1g11410 [Prunus mume]|uniref:G-type lectin S-receptor-like serine/threonine-protein kinase At1g11410 n=1 Tax=Prunus mume TaxID=102107 RepID=A0ABM0N5D0_PRUMU|nr:PREDICTED: G-type lectin S-receptor-like serine/threonine-protein kinase At1g11410 [Prunus mume]
MAMSLPLLCLISFFSFFLFSSHATDTLASSDKSGDNQTLVSSECSDGANFSKMTGSLPSTSGVSVSSIGISDCQTLCKTNCSCAGFASLQNESTCQLYYGSKQNLLKIIEKGAGLIYIRDRASSGNKKDSLWLIVAVPLASHLAFVSISLYCFVRWRRWRREDQARRREEGIINPDHEGSGAINMNVGRQKDQELPFFGISTIKAATNDFAKANKLGEGGFGPVYKGKLLPQGQEIAVKRLSKISRQGLNEFKNEISVICRLQHRNLVRLLGCCIEAEESILIYEYMPNKSLDSFIFDSTKRVLLDWRKRMNIIEGIAQGLLYLHKYSRLRIIHRDMKTSNILLDCDMNPKISDFGMARIFGDNDTRGQTNRVVGTFGYMSPEYAVDGRFSEKSDVFSFGVMLFEIISGKKNIAFFEADHSLNLLGIAWNLWKEGKSMELMDSTLSSSCSSSEVTRCIQMGLLCVQEKAMDRPTMSDVVSMLSNETMALPLPKEPAFFSRSSDAESSSNRKRCHSGNDITISDVDGR